MSMTGIIPINARKAFAELLRTAAASANHPAYIAIGRGTTALTVNDTKLEDEVVRIAASVLLESTDTFVIIGAFTITEEIAGNFAECGVFDAETGGTMYYRGGFHSGSPVGLYTCTARTLASGLVCLIKIKIKVNTP